MRLTPVYIICSPRPQVGKTLIARQLTEFLLLLRGDVKAYDINLREPSLQDFLPQLTSAADITDNFSKMKLMDRMILNDGVAKVIDLGYHAFDECFKMISEIGFMKEAARRGVRPMILFIADTDRISARGYETLCDTMPFESLTVIDNEQVLRGELPRAYGHGPVLQIAALAPFLKTYVDRLQFSFTGYLRGERDPSTELNQWIRANYTSFRDMERDLLG